MSNICGKSRSIGFLLWHTSLRLRANMDCALAPLELNHTEAIFLGSFRWLVTSGIEPSQRELADQAGLDPLVASQVARRLESRGLIVLDDHQLDTRAFRLMPTSAGTELTVKLMPILMRLEADMIKALGNDQEAFRRLLQRTLRHFGGSECLSGEEAKETQKTIRANVQACSAKKELGQSPRKS